METPESLECGLEMVECARSTVEILRGCFNCPEQAGSSCRPSARAPHETLPGDFSLGSGEGFLLPVPSPPMDPGMRTPVCEWAVG